MKKAGNAAPKMSSLQPQKSEKPGWLKSHEHIHAANCGHKSYVHGNHIDYDCDGHFHYVENGRTYECMGPNAKVLPFPHKK